MTRSEFVQDVKTGNVIQNILEEDPQVYTKHILCYTALLFFFLTEIKWADMPRWADFFFLLTTTLTYSTSQ